MRILPSWLVRSPIALLLALLLASPVLVAGAAEETQGARSEAVTGALDTLRQAATLDSNMVGDDGAVTDTWRAYLVLRDQATTDGLIRLTRDANKIVSCYAAQALAERRDPFDALAICYEHLEDTAAVTTFRGCIKENRQAGDVILEGLRPRLEEAQREELAERLVQAGTSLDARDRELALRTFRAKLQPRIRRLAESGVEAAWVALARYEDARDVGLLQKRLARDGDRLVERHYALRAAAVFAHPDLLPALMALRPEAIATLQSDIVPRLRFWLAALVAQGGQPVADFLQALLLAPEVPAAKRPDLRAAVATALATSNDAAFESLKRTLAGRR